MFGICVIFLLLIIALIFIGLLVIKKKGQECSQAVNEDPKPLEAIYDDPDAVAQDKEVTTADNAAYSTQLQVLQDKEVTTADNVAYSTQPQILYDEEVTTQNNLAYNVASSVS